MSYKSPVNGSELREVQRDGETALLDVQTSETYTPEYAKENFEEFVDGKTAKAEAEKAAKKKSTKKDEEK